MNYLIKLLKSDISKSFHCAWLDDLNRVASARKAYSTHFLVFVNRCFQRVKQAILLTDKMALTS